MLLIGSGWDIDRVLRVVAHRVNGVRNAPEASGPTPSVAPEFRDFRRVASLMRDLERRRELDIAYRRHGSSTSLVLRFSPADHGDLAQTELKRLLGVNLDLSECAVVESPASPDRDEVVLLTRSLLGAMFYLSQSVETPRADREHGRRPHHPRRRGRSIRSGGSHRRSAAHPLGLASPRTSVRRRALSRIVVLSCG